MIVAGHAEVATSRDLIIEEDQQPLVIGQTIVPGGAARADNPLDSKIKFFVPQTERATRDRADSSLQQPYRIISGYFLIVI